MGTKHGFSVFIHYYKPYLGLFFLDMACALLICAVDLTFPYISRLSMQTLLPQGLFRTFFTVMLAMGLAYVLKGGLYYIVTYWGHIMGANIEADIRRDLFAHMQTLSFSFFDRNRTGQLMSRITGDLFEIGELAHHGPEDLFISLVTLFGAFFVLLSIRWELALAVFSVVPIFVVFTVFQRRHMSQVSLGVKKRLAVINGEVESSLSGIRTAQAFTNEAVENQKFNVSNDQFRSAKRDYYQAMALYQSGMELCLGLMSVVVIAAGGYFIQRGAMDYTDLITFSLYVTTFITPIRELSAFVEQFMQGMAGFQRFLTLMRTDSEICDAPDAKDLDTPQGRVDWNQVTFSYGPGQPEVLKNINLHISPGETLAVVGPSGGGKTTLCQLLPRFYDVTDGSITLDGTDIRTLTLASLRKNIGIVQQDVFLFAGTIYDNIAYGKPGATESEVIEAAQKADLYEDIQALPQGFQTYVGERGVLLSGGQKQRISIARVFLKDPRILILDEATSALDTITERRIQKAFEELSRGRTTILIAHRLSTVQEADQIVVLDGNRIVEQGTWQSLTEQNGIFARLCATQQLAGTANGKEG